MNEPADVVSGAITRCLAVQWAADGILVNNVAPGCVETGLNRALLFRARVGSWFDKWISLGGVGRPAEIQQIVAALMSGTMIFLAEETIHAGGQGINH